MVTRSPKRLLLAAALVLGLFAFAPGTASAQFTDPANLQISSPTASGSDPVQLGGTGEVWVSNINNGGGAGADKSLNANWLLILGIPDATSTSTTITAINGNTLMTPLTGTYEASFTQAGHDAYSVLQNTPGSGVFPQTDSSNNWSNWTTYGTTQDSSASFFGLFEYTIPVGLDLKATDKFQFSNLPVGTYVIAYGIANDGSGKDLDTAFTHTGLETGNSPNFATPEPSTMALALSGLVGAGFAGLRRLRRTRAATV